jgi:hypothetical protein
MVLELNAARAGPQSSNVVDRTGSRGRTSAMRAAKGRDVVPMAGSAASSYPAAAPGVILNRHAFAPLTAESRISTRTGLPSTSSQ